MFNYRNLKTNQNHAYSKKLRQTLNEITSRLTIRATKNPKKKSNSKTTRLGRNAVDHTDFPHFSTKYKINEYLINETLKYSTILINVESELDFGAYECFSNNSAGSKAVKFYIYGGKIDFRFLKEFIRK